MRRRKLLTLVGGICLVLILTVLPFMAACAQPTPTPTEPIEFKVVGVFGPTHVGTIYLERFIDIVNERAKGELVLEYLGSGEVMSYGEMGAGVQKNIVQMLSAWAGLYSGLVEGVTQPLSLSRISPAEERAAGVYDYFNTVMNKQGLYFLGRSVTSIQPGSFYIMSTKQVVSPQDLAGLKIQLEERWAKFLTQDANAVPISIPDEEVYTAAERGLVDGSILTFDDYYSNSLFEVLKYILDHPFTIGSTARLINLEAWNSLPAHLRDIMMDVQMEEEVWATGQLKTRRAEMRQKILDEGVQFTTWSAADAQWLIDGMFVREWEDFMDRSPHTAKVRELLEQ